MTKPANVTVKVNDTYETFAMVKGCNGMIGIQIGKYNFSHQTETHFGDWSLTNRSVTSYGCNSSCGNQQMGIRYVKFSFSVDDSLLSIFENTLPLVGPIGFVYNNQNSDNTSEAFIQVMRNDIDGGATSIAPSINGLTNDSETNGTTSTSNSMTSSKCIGQCFHVIMFLVMIMNIL